MNSIIKGAGIWFIYIVNVPSESGQQNWLNWKNWFVCYESLLLVTRSWYTAAAKNCWLAVVMSHCWWSAGPQLWFRSISDQLSVFPLLMRGKGSSTFSGPVDLKLYGHTISLLVLKKFIMYYIPRFPCLI